MSGYFRPKPKHRNFRVQPSADPGGALEAVCTKRRFSTERDVKAAAEGLHHVGMKSYYLCQYCQSWHMSSQRNHSPWAHLPRLPADEFRVCMQIKRLLEGPAC